LNQRTGQWGKDWDIDEDEDELELMVLLAPLAPVIGPVSVLLDATSDVADTSLCSDL